MSDMPGSVQPSEGDGSTDDRSVEREEKKAAKKAQNKRDGLKRTISWKDADDGEALTEVKEFQARPEANAAPAEVDDHGSACCIIS